MTHKQALNDAIPETYMCRVRSFMHYNDKLTCGMAEAQNEAYFDTSWIVVQ